MTFILIDWANNRLTDFEGNDLEFSSFEEGWDYIFENYSEELYSDLFIIDEDRY